MKVYPAIHFISASETISKSMKRTLLKRKQIKLVCNLHWNFRHVHTVDNNCIHTMAYIYTRTVKINNIQFYLISLSLLLSFFCLFFFSFSMTFLKIENRKKNLFTSSANYYLYSTYVLV